MSRCHGQYVVTWLERGGDRFLRLTQPYVYQQFLLHVGATDILRQYDCASAYWQYVQAILDSFFTSAQRALMCGELIEQRIFDGREDFGPFLIQARAELQAQKMIASVEVMAEMRGAVRSVG